MHLRGLLATFTLLGTFLPASPIVAQIPARSVGGPPVPVTAEWPRIKIGPSALAGIPMVGVERPLLLARRSFQWDVVLSPWRSIDGYPFQFVAGTAEWRFYRRDARDGWYSALHVGSAVFRLQRPDYADTTLYQEGASMFGGGSVGHVWQIRSGWTVDAYVGGGTVQSLYKGYDRLTGRRYDGARLWNVSGELLPYRVGLMVGTPLR